MLRIRSGSHWGPAVARLTAGRRVCRKYRRAYIRKLQQQEYDKLRSIVPSLAGKQRKKRVSKIKVIEATIQYIDQLHHALAERLQGAGGSTKVNEEQVAEAAKHLFAEKKTQMTSSRADNSQLTSSRADNSQCHVVCEKDRRIPSYLLQSDALSRHVE